MRAYFQPGIRRFTIWLIIGVAAIAFRIGLVLWLCAQHPLAAAALLVVSILIRRIDGVLKAGPQPADFEQFKAGRDD